MVYSALKCAGNNVALYTSPHLVDLRERIMVDGAPIPRDAFVHWTTTLKSVIEKCDASFFEATTAIAFADFAARGADIAVVEVGLGGRLDATNVVSPLVSAVTNVGLEHTEYLGDSLDQIAWEKAGIAKPGRPFVVGEGDADLANHVGKCASERGAEVHILPADRTYSGPMTLTGEYQRRNAAVAEEVLNLLPASVRPDPAGIRGGIQSAFVPGRFDRRGSWLFDVAHNPSGIRALVDQIQGAALPRPIHALVAMANDKDWETVLPMVRAAVDVMWVTVAPSMPADRKPDIGMVAARVDTGTFFEPDFENALELMKSDAGTALVTGSFFTVGDALARLPGFAPLG
jgi:dihydrofolate synthase/folylpolyglutamate synthase